MKTDLNSKKKGPQDYQTLKIELFLVNLEKTGNKHVVVLKKKRILIQRKGASRSFDVN